MLSQNQSRYLNTIGFALLALLFASDLLLKPPKELVSLAIACISALYFTATLFVGLKERKKGAVVASAVGVDSYLVFAVGEHAVCVVVFDVQ